MAGGVRASIWVLVALTIAAPHLWLHAGADAGADALEALLPAWAFVLLAVWSASEYRRWRTAAPVLGPPAGEAPAATDRATAESGGARQVGAVHR